MAYSANDHKAAERALHELLQSFKMNMKTGISDLGIPSLDPLSVEEDNSIPVKQDMMLNLRNVKVSGLSSFQCIEMESSEGAVVAHIVIGNVHMGGKYSMGKANSSFETKLRDVSLRIPLETKVHNIVLEDLKNAKIAEIQITVGRSLSHLDHLHARPGEKQETLKEPFDDILVLFFKAHVSTLLQNELNKFLQAKIVEAPSLLSRVLAYPTNDEATLHAAAMKALPMGLNSSPTPGNLDALIDLILPNINADIKKNGYDPYKISESKKYSIGIAGVKVDQVVINGLSHLHRTGPVNIDKLTVTVNIGVDSAVTGSAGVKVWVTLVSLHPAVTFTATNVKFTAVITIKKNDKGEIILNLDSLDIADPNIDVLITGLGTLGWMLSGLTDIISALVVGLFKDQIVKMVKDKLNDELKKIKLPI